MPTSDSLFQSAVQSHQAGDVDRATELYRAILAQEPHHADALHMLGIIARQKGNTELALKLMEAALAVKPELALAWYNRSLILRAMERSHDALYSVQQALHYDAALGDAWDMAATLLREAGKLNEAVEYQAKALALHPDNVRYCGNYAILLMAKGDLRNAYKTLCDSKSHNVDYLSFALGNVLRACGYAEKAIPYYHRFSSVAPDSSEVKMNEAMAWLQIGEMEKAWAIWNKILPDTKEKLKDIPLWQGETTDHLLLHEEQGLGDALQCVRYIPLLRGRVGKITLQLSALLQKLMQFNFPDIDVIALDDDVPPATARVQLMSLPALLGTSIATIPSSDTSYLRSDESWRTPWLARLEKIQHPRIGFVWAGNPSHRNNHNRSLTLQQFAPLLEVTRGHAISLQKWSNKDVVGLAAAGLYDADPYLDDFTSTAGLIMALDLVVTVDTSVAHLAAALGKPVWVLVPFDPDWRWMLGRDDSPWYPTLRLFRQSVPGDWATALTPMSKELHKLMQGDKSVLIPKVWVGPPPRQNPFALPLDFTLLS